MVKDLIRYQHKKCNVACGCALLAHVFLHVAVTIPFHSVIIHTKPCPCQTRYFTTRCQYFPEVDSGILLYSRRSSPEVLGQFTPQSLIPHTVGNLILLYHQLHPQAKWMRQDMITTMGMRNPYLSGLAR